MMTSLWEVVVDEALNGGGWTFGFYLPFLILDEYNLFFKKQLMDFASVLNFYEEQDLFDYSSLIRAQESLEEYKPTVWQPNNTLQKRDSSYSVSQFLSLNDKYQPLTSQSQSEDSINDNNVTLDNLTPHLQNDCFSKRGRKIKKNQNSPFHNYQKHLNNALKKMVRVPTFQVNDPTYKKAAQQIWVIYVGNQIKTKKILHAIFNEKNEHQPDQQELKKYGMWEIYIQYGQKTYNDAKNYLSGLAAQQITEENIERHLRSTKLKKKEMFKEYLYDFRQELTNGYLKKRVNFQQVIN